MSRRALEVDEMLIVGIVLVIDGIDHTCHEWIDEYTHQGLDMGTVSCENNMRL